MTNRELDNWLAQNLMGWKKEKRFGTPPYGIFYWIDESLSYKWLRPSEGWEAWQPTESISDAFLVVEKLSEKGIIISLMDQLGYEADDNGNLVKDKIWRIQFMDSIAHDKTNNRSKIWFPVAENESLPLALCLAGKAAIEGG